jgi:hypothetical protein
LTDAGHYLPNTATSPEVAAIIASFRRPTYTVAEMEGDGFTDVMGVCSACGSRRRPLARPHRAEPC